MKNFISYLKGHYVVVKNKIQTENVNIYNIR